MGKRERNFCIALMTVMLVGTIYLIFLMAAEGNREDERLARQAYERVEIACGPEKLALFRRVHQGGASVVPDSYSWAERCAVGSENPEEEK